MVRNAVSFLLLILFLGGCTSTPNAGKSESTEPAPLGKDLEPISLVDDAALRVRYGDASAFDSVEVRGKPYVVNLEYLPGKEFLGIVRQFNRRIEGDHPSYFILVVGNKRLAPLAYFDGRSDTDKVEGNSNKEAIKSLEDAGSINSTLSITNNLTTSLLFELSGFEMAQPKKLILTIDLLHPKELKHNIEVDLK
jgi:hypothetical protein